MVSIGTAVLPLWGELMKNIMIMAKDSDACVDIRRILNQDGFRFVCCSDADEAWETVRTRKTDIIVADTEDIGDAVMDFLIRFRAIRHTPVVIVAAESAPAQEKETFLEAGADEYIRRPFSIMILRARVSGLLRFGQPRSSIFSQDGLEFDFDNGIFFEGDRKLNIPPVEQRILKVLCECRGHTVSRSRLMDAVWGGAKEMDENITLTVSVGRLRSRFSTDHIRTVRGTGYTWE